MVTFYSGATEARNVEHSNYKFGLDKTLSILFKSAEVSSLGSPLLIGFGLGLVEAEALVQIKTLLRSYMPRANTGETVILHQLCERSVQSGYPQRAIFIAWVGRVSWLL